MCLLFSIEIDQNVETDSDLSESQEDPDVSYGNIYFTPIVTYVI